MGEGRAPRGAEMPTASKEATEETREMTTPRHTGGQNNWDITETHLNRLDGTVIDATFDEVNQ